MGMRVVAAIRLPARPRAGRRAPAQRAPEPAGDATSACCTPPRDMRRATHPYTRRPTTQPPRHPGRPRRAARSARSTPLPCRPLLRAADPPLRVMSCSLCRMRPMLRGAGVSSVPCPYLMNCLGRHAVRARCSQGPRDTLPALTALTACASGVSTAADDVDTLQHCSDWRARAWRGGRRDSGASGQVTACDDAVRSASRQRRPSITSPPARDIAVLFVVLWSHTTPQSLPAARKRKSPRTVHSWYQRGQCNTEQQWGSLACQRGGLQAAGMRGAMRGSGYASAAARAGVLRRRPRPGCATARRW